MQNALVAKFRKKRFAETPAIFGEGARFDTSSERSRLSLRGSDEVSAPTAALAV